MNLKLIIHCSACFCAPVCFFFNDTATTEIYTLSLHDALPIFASAVAPFVSVPWAARGSSLCDLRSEEHTSELQSHHDLVCRLLLEKNKKCGLLRWGVLVVGVGTVCWGGAWAA